MEKIRAAVVGCGNISVMHLDALKTLNNVELIAVCDIKPERAEAARDKYSVKCYTDYELMFKNEDLDMVCICLPHYLHTVVARAAFRYGINVLSEKPIGTDYEDAVETCSLANTCGVLYGVIFQCRYNTTSKKIKEYIESGKLGAVKSAVSILTWNRNDVYYSLSDWKGTWDKEGGGVIIDQAIHSIDLTNWLIDSKPISIEASLHNRNHTIIRVEDTAEGCIRYENGVVYSFFAMNNFFIDYPIEIRLVCENGTAVLSSEYADVTFSDGTTEHIDNEPQQLVSYSGGKPYWGNQHAVQINQFVRSVMGLEKLDISAEDALKTQKIISDIYRVGKEKM